MKNVYILMYLFGLLGFLSYNKHLLVMLLMMEFMVLGLILEVGMVMSMIMFSWVLLLMMFMLVCESVIGISSIILLSRSYSGDMVEGMNLMKC